MKAPSDSQLRWAVAAALVFWLAMPLYHPDLYWHLTSGARILETWSLPSSDWLSFTRAGRPWVEPEWLPQLLFAAVFKAAGMPGLWALKAASLLALAGILWAWCRDLELAPAYRAAAVAAAAAASWPRSDLRPETVSTLLLAGLWWRLERGRRKGGPDPGQGGSLSPLAYGLLFALWASCHPGFVYGLALLAGFTLLDRCLWKALAAAVAGSFVQPLGFGVYQVLWEHASRMRTLSASILEWSPPPLLGPWHRAYWLLWAASLACVGAAVARRKAPAAVAIPLLLLAAASARHMRDACYFAAVAAPLSLSLARDLGWLPEPPAPRHRWASAAVVAAAAAFLFVETRSQGGFRSWANGYNVPVRAADFLGRERAALRGGPDPGRGVRLYNRWGWGSYLGWRLHPDYLTFQDGRFLLFYPFLGEVDYASKSPARWQAMLDRWSVTVALMESVPLRWSVFMPRERWALAYRDDQAQIFVRRATVDPAWLAAHEIRPPE